MWLFGAKQAEEGFGTNPVGKTGGAETESTTIPAMNERILVVNDEDPIREIVCSTLAASGYECQQAADGLKALAILDSGKKFDLLLCNLMMPNMSGLELLERTRHKFSDIPFVMESACQDVSVFLAAVRNGAYDYLQTPFEREQMLVVVRRALEYRRLKLENRALRARLTRQTGKANSKDER
jgi:DNA-binding NtrC family response regulator